MRFSQLSNTVVLSASSGAREHGAERPRHQHGHQVHLAEDSSAVFCRVLFIGASSRVVDAVDHDCDVSITSPPRAAHYTHRPPNGHRMRPTPPPTHAPTATSRL